MAAYEARVVTTTRYEYAIRKESANWAEVDKAFAAARADMNVGLPPGTSRGGDDAVWITADEENIIIYWEEDK